MPSYSYCLGPADKLEQLFPPPDVADPELGFKTYADVIRKYTNDSLVNDGIKQEDIQQIDVTSGNGMYNITLTASTTLEMLTRFGNRHATIFDKDHAQKAIRGMELLKKFNVWNPLENYHVNWSSTDGTSKWHLFPPLGLNVVGQKGILMLHYPPWAVVQKGTVTNAITARRWIQVLTCAGMTPEEVGYFRTFVNVNPIAAPGSGQSEYPNDYLPIMMASAFFDGAPDRDYIRSMLELYLTPPDWPEERKYTLPLLICGSPLYDPQPAGWFRTTYTDILPQDQYGIPQVDLLQAGSFRVNPDSKRETPYMIGNHQIAAGVTGVCSDNPAKIPDIRQYEAQDLVSASFLKIYMDNPDISPQDARARACLRWYGNEAGTGAPVPKDENDRLTICALAQMDMFFEPEPRPESQFTFEEALKRCQADPDPGNPCSGFRKPGYSSQVWTTDPRGALYR